MKKFMALSLAAVMLLLSAAILALPASAGEFITTHNLPAEYVELEYIETDGNMAINTGIYATTKSRYELTVQVTNTTLASSDKGGNGGSGTYAGIVGVNWGGGTKSGRLQISYGRENADFNIALGKINNQQNNKDTNKHTVIIDAKNCKAYFDGVEALNSDVETVGLSDENLNLIGIGAANYKSTKGEFAASSRCAAKIYYVKISNDDVVDGEFIPAYRVADKKVGMYDLVTKKFFENVHSEANFIMPDDAVLVNPNPGTTNPPAAATGDNTIIVLAAVAAVTLAGSIVIFRRRRVND
jgi:LPXTG-motif cell wall-anchored protein